MTTPETQRLASWSTVALESDVVARNCPTATAPYAK